MSSLSHGHRSDVEGGRRVATDRRHGIGGDVGRRGIGTVHQQNRQLLESIRRVYKVVATARERIRVLVSSLEISFRPRRSLHPASRRHL